RRCLKCEGLVYSNKSSKGSCSADRGSHDPAPGRAYLIDLNSPGSRGRDGWRWCQACLGLFFAGGSSLLGVCPVNQCGHDDAHSGNYILRSFEDVGPWLPDGCQADWWLCSKCAGLFFGSIAYTEDGRT